MGPLDRITHELWPGMPVIPGLEPGASDAQFLDPAGIPTYGISGLFVDPDNGNIHGLNDRARIVSVHESRTFLCRLVKAYTTQ
jgi:acetylornithine deacetylase/succinyl-diaminopimelate desuccinylase-like protein